MKLSLHSDTVHLPLGGVGEPRRAWGSPGCSARGGSRPRGAPAPLNARPLHGPRCTHHTFACSSAPKGSSTRAEQPWKLEGTPGCTFFAAGCTLPGPLGSGPLRAWGTTLGIPFPGRHLQADGKVPEHFSFPSLPLTYCRDLASGPLIKKGPW